MYELVNRIATAAHTGVKAASTELFTKPAKSPVKVLTGLQAKLSTLLGRAPMSMFGEIHYLQEDLDNEIAQVKAHGVRPEIWAQLEAEMGYPFYCNQLHDLEVRLSDPEVVRVARREKADEGISRRAAKRIGGKHRKVNA